MKDSLLVLIGICWGGGISLLLSCIIYELRDFREKDRRCAVCRQMNPEYYDEDLGLVCEKCDADLRDVDAYLVRLSEKI